MKTIKYDFHNRTQRGHYEYKYFYNQQEIGYLSIRTNGQIGVYFIKKEYRNIGLGKLFLNQAKDELNISNFWCVTKKNKFMIKILF
jgi:hypothetical protein